MLCEPFGKRRAMQIVSIPMFVAWMFFHFASHVNHLYAGLALAGLGGGLMEAPVSNKLNQIRTIGRSSIQPKNMSTNTLNK